MNTMTQLDRLRAAFPEPWDVVAHRTQHVTATTHRGYARAVMFGDLVTVIGRGKDVPAAVDACIAARDEFLRPWIERAISECAMRMRSKCGDHCQHCDEAAPGWSREEITNAVLRGEE